MGSIIKDFRQYPYCVYANLNNLQVRVPPTVATN